MSVISSLTYKSKTKKVVKKYLKIGQAIVIIECASMLCKKGQRPYGGGEEDE